MPISYPSDFKPVKVETSLFFIYQMEEANYTIRFIRKCLKGSSCQAGVIFVNLEISRSRLLLLPTTTKGESMDIPMELSLEQKFNLKLYEEQVKHLSPEESQQFVLELMRQLMVKENVIRHLIQQV